MIFDFVHHLLLAASAVGVVLISSRQRRLDHRTSRFDHRLFFDGCCTPLRVPAECSVHSDR